MTKRLYYHDSFLYDFDAEVVDIIAPSKENPRPALVLDRTAFYPASGGQVFDTGWIGPERPKKVCVQSTGCAPIVKAWDDGSSSSEIWGNASTIAAGLRVPKAYGDYIILDILRKSGGTAVAVTDEEIMDALHHWARVEGLFAAPEGAAALAAYRKLRSNGFFGPDDSVVLFNTGTGLKYLDVIEGQTRSARLAASRYLGGIIGPY